MNNTQQTLKSDPDQTVVSSYVKHSAAEAAVRRLAASGFPINKVSIIGRHFEPDEDIVVFYRPADAAFDGAEQGAVGFFVLPVVGSLVVIGPLAGFIAGAIGGAGVGALINGLVAMGIPRHQAMKYQERLQAGEFLVALHGDSCEIARAQEALNPTAHSDLQTCFVASKDPETSFQGT